MNNYKQLLERIAKNSRNLINVISQDTPNISYYDEELYYEALSDQREFGADCRVLVWCDPKDDFVKDYDFILDEKDNSCFLEGRNESDTYQATIDELIFILKFQSSIITDFGLISHEVLKQQAVANKKKSEAGKKGWAKLTPEERSRIARERGRAGAEKRWKKLPKSD